MYESFEDYSEFFTEEEIEEAINNELLEIAEIAEEEDNLDSIVNPRAVKAVLVTAKLMKELTEKTGAKVTYELHKPYKSVGSVTVTCKNIYFKDSEKFNIAARLASNIDIYQKRKGMIQIDFTFHGLTSTF